MAENAQTVVVDGRRIRMSNLGKVLYPATGTTKGEVIDYYARIAPVLLPHVTGRPVTRKRWPDGVGDPQHPTTVFFAKDLERGAPDWVPRMPIVHSTGTKYYPLVEDVPTLVYLAQVASLELHVPQWRFAPDGAPGDPDRLVLDLDPGEGTGLAECAEVARWARAILADIGLESFPVTSGGKGIHVYCALPGGQTSVQASAVAKELAQALAADHPDLVVSAMAKAVRPGHVFVDWSQNSASKTTVAPYSLRGRAHPTVAAPRTWDELDDPALAQLEFREVLARVDTAGDPIAALGFHHGVRAAARQPLATYIAKRSADRTPEPVPADPRAPATTPGAQPRFVIQEHHARRLHYDLRLERGGVFVSWAVPKGVPDTPQRNHLAVMTEDHPLEYGSFEGTIPKGEYGAGAVTIWDDGTYELEKWRDDEIIFTLVGRPGGPLGRVRLALIRTDGEGEKSTWLLHRMKAGAEPAGTASREGTATDADAAPAASARPPGALEPAALRPQLCETAPPALARTAARRWGPPEWAEVKWDGIRALGFWDGSRLHLRARSGADITARYPELSAIDAGLGDEAAIVDGEIVALDDTGRPSFPRLQTRMHLADAAEIVAQAKRTPVRFHLFDVLSAGGEPLIDRPLQERRAILERVAAHPADAIDTPPVFHDVDDALETSLALGLEGVVVKNPHGRYRPGTRSGDWLKVKNTRTQEVVIGGIRPGKGARAGSIGSLLMGVPGADGLRYVGRVGTGFTDRALARLAETLAPLASDETPFVDVPAADASDARWVRPEVVGEVEYAEATGDGRLRHARWRGLRPDKSPAEVRWE